MIEYQQIENRKLQEQINVLENDLELVQSHVKKLQKKLNTSNDLIHEKDTKISSLEEIVNALRIEKNAFENFTTQNKFLLNKFLHEHQESMSSYEELTKTRQDMKAMSDAIELKSQQMIEKEIKLESEIRKLKEQLTIETKQGQELIKQVEILTNQLQTLQALYTQQHEFKTDEIRRFKTMEYQNLLKSDLKLLEFYHLKDNYETLQETLQLSSTQSDNLTKRLNDLMNEKDEINTILYQFVQQTEDKNYHNRIKEKKLLKENESLQQEVMNLKKAIREISERNEAIEKELEQEKVKYILEKKYEEVKNHKQGKILKKKSKNEQINWSLITSGSLEGTRSGLGHEMGSLSIESDSKKLPNRLSQSSSNIFPNIHSQNIPQRSSTAGKKTRRDKGPDDQLKKISNKISPPMDNSEVLLNSSLERSSEEEHFDSKDSQIFDAPHEPAVSGVDLESSFYESSTSQILEKYDNERSLYTSASASASKEELKQNSTDHLGFSAVDTFQYQGKRCLLAKYLRHLVTLMNTLSLPPTLKINSIDLSRSSLTDMDMIQVIDWIRLISIREINFIDFRYNLLTHHGMSYLATWILSLDHKDLSDRIEPLHLYCQYNLVCYFSFLFLVSRLIIIFSSLS